MLATRHHVAVFFLTYTSFALYHSTRKSLTNTKDLFSRELSPIPCNVSWPCLHPYKKWNSHHLFSEYDDAATFLGVTDTVFLFAYAVGLFVSGTLGDRFQLRIALAVGMWLSSCMVFLFGTLTEWLHLYSKPFYLVISCLNGIFQSTGWPCVVAIMGNWFGKNKRGLLFGIWSSNVAFGNIVGSLIASTLVDYGYEVVFLFASVTLFCGGFVAFFGIVGSPEEIGLESPTIPATNHGDIAGSSNSAVPSSEDSQMETHNEQKSLIQVQTESKPITISKAISLPGLVTYSLVNGIVKLVNYSIIYWLPYYLTNNYDWSVSTADQLSIWYDVGAIVGSIAFGSLSDWMGKRSPVLMFMFFVGPFTIWGYQQSPKNEAINGVLMSIVGLFIGGASNIIGTAVTADIGKQEAVGKNTDALATVTGITDGVGNIGSGIGQFLVPLIQVHAGWSWVFYSLIIEVGFAMLVLLPAFVRDIQSMNLFTRWRSTSASLLERSQED